MRKRKIANDMTTEAITVLPVVNIITVVYNAAFDLEKTILSVAKQDYPRINFIVIDGGSTDGTKGILNKYRNSIQYFVSERDGGIYHAMNKGIAATSEGYISFLNAGDEFVDCKVVSDFFSDFEKDVDLLYGNIIVGDITDEKLNNPQQALDFTFENLLQYEAGVICHQAMFIRKEATPEYDTSFIIKGDLDWYFEILKKSKNLRYKKKDVVVVAYKGGGMSEKRYIRDVYELSTVIIRRCGLHSYFEYGYPGAIARRIVKECIKSCTSKK